MSTPHLFTAILIDDDNTNNFINEMQLANSGRFHPLLTFADPMQAYEHIKHNCLRIKTHSLANLVLVDINMPMIDGFELIEKMKASCPDILEQTAICILTTSNHQKDIEKANFLEVEHYLIKPLTRKDIDHLIYLLESKAA